MYSYTTYQGLGKKCGWFCRQKGKLKKIAGLLGFPVGTILSAVIEIAVNDPKNDPQRFAPTSQIEFSIIIDKQLDSWAAQRFNKWYESKLLLFKGKKTKAQLLHITTIKLVNNVLNEMQNLIKYYQVNAKGRDLNYAKSVVLTEVLSDYKELYINALASVNGKIYTGTNPVGTRNITNGPDRVDWKGRSYTIEVPFFSSKPVTTVVLPPYPVDVKPNPPKPLPTLDIDIIRPSKPTYQTPPFRPDTKPVVTTEKPHTKPVVQITKPAKPTIVVNTPKEESNTKTKVLKGTVAVVTIIGISKLFNKKKKKKAGK